MRTRLAILASITALNLTTTATSGILDGTHTDPLLQTLQLLSYKPPSDQSFMLNNSLLAKAKPDECFSNIGGSYTTPTVNGRCESGKPKTNEAYAWGLTQSGSKLILGTASNVLCLAQGVLAFGALTPTLTKSWVCEFGSSTFKDTLPSPLNTSIPDGLGDWRPPNIYSYDLSSKSLTKLTPRDDKLYTTLGLRSAGSIGDVAILAGPSLTSGLLGVNFFAFDTNLGTYLGSCSTDAYNNIRQFTIFNNKLYAGVGTATGGGVIKWVGPLSGSTCGFEQVATLPGDAAFITNYGSDRLAVSAWAGPAGSGAGKAGVYLSPRITTELTAADNIPNTWKQLWKPYDYEPDPVVAQTYLGGAIAYWGGALYFGTMHVPGTSTLAHIGCTNPTLCFGTPSGTQELLNVFTSTNRATSIWKISQADSSAPKVTLLYGESDLPALVPNTKTFVYKSTGFKPVFGKSGFGNPFNNYSWTAAVYKGRLMFGTMDYRYLIDSLASSYLGDIGGGMLGGLGGAILGGIGDDVIGGAMLGDISKVLFASIPQAVPPMINGYMKGFGADLWRFDSVISSAKPIDVRGEGNYLNYGIRTMIPSSDGKELFIGTANPMNLEQQGGWELRSLNDGLTLLPFYGLPLLPF